jgi:hypothetical protein
MLIVIKMNIGSNTNLSVKQECGIMYEDTFHYVNINSGLRNFQQYPFHFDYKINLGNDYRNVAEISIVSMVVPNTAGITSEPYLTLDLGDLNFISFESSTVPHTGFANIVFDTPVGGFINCKVVDTSRILKSPIAKLSQITVKIRDVLGSLYKFGSNSGSFLKADQHSFVLKIRCREVSRQQINIRNVF